jgi:hypothetical protein
MNYNDDILKRLSCREYDKKVSACFGQPLEQMHDDDSSSYYKTMSQPEIAQSLGRTSIALFYRKLIFLTIGVQFIYRTSHA